MTGVIDGTGALLSAVTQVLLAYLDTDLIFYVFAIYTFLGGLALTPILIKDYRNRKNGGVNEKLIDKV